MSHHAELLADAWELGSFGGWEPFSEKVLKGSREARMARRSRGKGVVAASLYVLREMRWAIQRLIAESSLSSF